MAVPSGRTFYKLCGSGNDFVFFDAREEPAGGLSEPEAIRRLCARATGIGADGVVFLEPSPVAALRMAYYNSDGSRAAMCGNAALCTTRLAVELGAGAPAGFAFETDAGVVSARLRDGLPEIDLQPLGPLVPDAVIRPAGLERRIGFGVAGVPHLVVRLDDLEALAGIELSVRGRALRFDPSLADGANVNWIAPTGDGRGWRMRTYERGVEAETLACGTGAVACAAVLAAWGEAGDEVALVTSSGRPLRVRLPRSPGTGPSLAGEGRIVFSAQLGELT